MKYSYLVLFALIFSTGIVKSQVKKPDWLMPLYFSDANGDKDTIYFGYDPEAGRDSDEIDTIFGEKWVKEDTSGFNAYLWMYPGYAGGGPTVSDSFRKIDIRSGFFLHESIGFTHGKMPVTMKWEDSLFYSPKLGYPDLSPHPNARIDMYCDPGEPGYYSCGPIHGGFLSLTDDPSGLEWPLTDSMYFDGSGNLAAEYALRGLQISLVPYDYVYVDLEESPKGNKFNVYPNPVNTTMIIENMNLNQVKFNLYSLTGMQVYSNSSQEREIIVDMEFYADGIYYLSVVSSNEIFIHKILKNGNL